MTRKAFRISVSWLRRLFHGSPRRSHLLDQLHRQQTKISMTAVVLLMSAVRCQVFLAVRESVEFLSSLPFPGERLAGAPFQHRLASTTWGCCPEQTPCGGGQRDSALTWCHAQLPFSRLPLRLFNQKWCGIHRGCHVWVKIMVTEV